MANMKRCRAEMSIAVGESIEHFWPGLEIDFDRVLRPASPAEPARGKEGAEGYVPARPAVTGVTVANAVAGREDCFEDVTAAPSPGGRSSKSPAAASPQQE